MHEYVLGITLALSVLVITILSICLFRESIKKSKNKQVVIKAGRAKIIEGSNPSILACKRVSQL